MGGHQIGNTSRLCEKSVGGVGREMESPHPDLPQMGRESRSLIPSRLEKKHGGKFPGYSGERVYIPKGIHTGEKLKMLQSGAFLGHHLKPGMKREEP